jgi:hypothetical protein
VRTTLTLPVDVYEVVRSLSTERRIPLGEAVAILVRRGLQPAASIDTAQPFPCFRLSGRAKPITLERTLAVEDEM